jgi:type I restriction enzyme R subunit
MSSFFHLTSSTDSTYPQGARAKIRVMVKRILNKYGYPPDLQDEAVKTVLMQAELLCATWE